MGRMRIAAAMRAERARSGMPAHEVARRIGVATNTVYRWESATSSPPADGLSAYLYVVGATWGPLGVPHA